MRSIARRSLPEHPKLTHTTADLRDPTVRRALAGCDVIAHLGFQLWSTADAAAVNVGGTANVIAANPGRIVLASSAAVYGGWPDNALPLSEDDPARPNRQCPYAEDKLDAERRCAAAAPTTSLRICAVLGPHADPLVKKASAGLRQVVPAARGRRQALQFLHEDDAAAALLAAVKHSDVDGVYNIAPDDWLDEEGVADVSGGRVVRLPFPVLLHGSELARRLHLMDMGADRAVLLNGPLALDPSRAAQDLGWKAKQGSAEVLKGFLNPR
ncbi:MAG: NAD-dependent epimerase/dehydratase family protein [Acidimicrobiia bacterium]|nr:NAD-dependent epimerase/dehydratase family protein [Acidimicrobiia bacterium]